jgi:predicted small lipoprotein YifL
MKRSLVIATLISAFALTSCGIKGDLQRPAPLWGEDNRTEAEKAGKEDAKQQPAEKPARQKITIKAPKPVEGSPPS